MHAFGLVQRDEAFRAGHRGLGVERQPRVDFGRDPARHQRQDLAAKAHQQTVHDLVQRPAAALDHGGLQQRSVLRHLHCLENQGGVGRRILR
ncbi:hypothetical protein D3C78_1560400 [compost metagenome]